MVSSIIRATSTVISCMWTELESESDVEKHVRSTDSTSQHQAEQQEPVTTSVAHVVRGQKRKIELPEEVRGPLTWVSRLKTVMNVEGIAAVTKQRPIRMHTACSGTGCPVLACEAGDMTCELI